MHEPIKIAHPSLDATTPMMFEHKQLRVVFWPPLLWNTASQWKSYLEPVLVGCHCNKVSKTIHAQRERLAYLRGLDVLLSKWEDSLLLHLCLGGRGW